MTETKEQKYAKTVLDKLGIYFSGHTIWTREEIQNVINMAWLKVHENEI